MSSKQMYDIFDDLTTKELQIFLTMGVIYLQKNRNINFKTIIKDFNNCNKKADLKKRLIICI